ncbi:MAG: AMP-binding protein, partial [Acidobacteria bacterium]|nr:AMP-binding protein [Acidobacteriota bacterium]
MRQLVNADTLGLPETFNVATWFVDRNVAAGRGPRVAIECGDQRITYDEVLANVNRVGGGLRRLGVRPEERVALLLVDGPEFVYSFFGAIKIGAIPIPLNTLWKPADYAHVLQDSRAAAAIVSDELLQALEAVPAAQRASVRHIIAAGPDDASESHPYVRFSALIGQGADDCAAEPTSRDAPAFWVYSSGSTGKPKGCVHLHHDMVVCAEQMGKGVLGITERDRTFSVAKLFF